MKTQRKSEWLKKYDFKPKYTEEDLDVIRAELDKKTPVEDIFTLMLKRRNDIHPITIYRWIEKVAKGAR